MQLKHIKPTAWPLYMVTSVHYISDQMVVSVDGNTESVAYKKDYTETRAPSQDPKFSKTVDGIVDVSLKIMWPPQGTKKLSTQTPLGSRMGAAGYKGRWMEIVEIDSHLLDEFDDAANPHNGHLGNAMLFKHLSIALRSLIAGLGTGTTMFHNETVDGIFYRDLTSSSWGACAMRGVLNEAGAITALAWQKTQQGNVGPKHISLAKELGKNVMILDFDRRF